MTMHVVYDHECPACEALYIPYDEDVPCPRCGIVEEVARLVDRRGDHGEHRDEALPEHVVLVFEVLVEG